MTAVDQQVAQLSSLLRQHNYRMATAESCTGGLIAAHMTSLAGSSEVFERGWVTYTNEAKHAELGVDISVFEQHGAVSEACVLAMAKGALKYSAAQVSVAVSGIAGPSGATKDKPVGTVWIAWAIAHSACDALCFLFDGERQQVREQAVAQALAGLIQRLTSSN